MYRIGATNRADALTRREQELDSQRAAAIALRTQTVLGPEQLDLQIQRELELDYDDPEMAAIETSNIDLIDELL